jgi:23S rRNA (guanosine2251-2'-O)-methyltransferase
MEEKRKTEAVAGRNPVLELLRSQQELECVYIQAGLGKGPLGRIIALAKERGIPVKEATPEKLLALSGIQSHQGVAAVPAAAEYARMEDILERAGDQPLFVVLADGVEDPHNLGAIIRTAEAAGAHGVIIPKRRSAGLTAAAVKSSAGAAAHLPVVRVANLASAMEELKKSRNVWFYCADMDGESWCSADYRGNVGLVVGSEGSGVSRLIKEKCDFVVSLPMKGKINSLNASVAAGIIMYEIARQRLGLRAR